MWLDRVASIEVRLLLSLCSSRRLRMKAGSHVRKKHYQKMYGETFAIRAELKRKKAVDLLSVLDPKFVGAAPNVFAFVEKYCLHEFRKSFFHWERRKNIDPSLWFCEETKSHNFLNFSFGNVSRRYGCTHEGGFTLSFQNLVGQQEERCLKNWDPNVEL